MEDHTVPDTIARASLVHHLEEPGLLTGQELSQDDILKEAPVGVAQQYFNLSLKELGPYALNYSRNGRYLLLGGRKGHLASFDWRGKELQCEIQVRETIRDIHYLHNETMFAAAQKRFVYIYDDHGTEIHCIKKMEHINKLTFLPYHYLLVSAVRDRKIVALHCPFPFSLSFLLSPLRVKEVSCHI
jgi:U3 small nucleolar RNA-associated protein 7